MRLLTVDEVCDFLKLSERTVGDMLRDGRLPGRKVGTGRGQWRIPEDELQQYARGEYEPKASTLKLPMR